MKQQSTPCSVPSAGPAPHGWMGGSWQVPGCILATFAVGVLWVSTLPVVVPPPPPCWSQASFVRFLSGWPRPNCHLSSFGIFRCSENGNHRNCHLTLECLYDCWFLDLQFNLKSFPPTQPPLIPRARLLFNPEDPPQGGWGRGRTRYWREVPKFFGEIRALRGRHSSPPLPPLGS